MDRTNISVITPVYGCKTSLYELYYSLKKELETLTPDFEIIMVNDASPDGAWETIAELAKKDQRVKGIDLSRNFGQHYAITAGIEMSKGEYIILMDCDLQDDPKHIPLLLQKCHEGFDTVFTKRIDRKHSFFKQISTKIYNFLFIMFSDKSYDINVGSLVIFNSKVRNEILRLKDKDRLYIQLLKWVGFRQTYLPVEHRNRVDGKSSYSFFSLLEMAIQGWTSHSDKLLRVSIYLGFSISCLTFLAGIYVIILYLTKGLAPGWPSLILSILFSTGLILMSIGVTGIYIGKIFDQVKGRPLYIIKDTINF